VVVVIRPADSNRIAQVDAWDDANVRIDGRDP
jgi:hypothetical protein